MCDSNIFYDNDQEKDYYEFKKDEISNINAPDPSPIPTPEPFNYPGDMQIPHFDRPYDKGWNSMPNLSKTDMYGFWKQYSSEKAADNRKYLYIILFIIIIGILIFYFLRL